VDLDSDLSISRQCALLDLPRSSFYYEPCAANDRDLHLMRLIDEEYTEHPFYGSRRLVERLRGLGYSVCRDKVRRLMRLMGIEAVYQKPLLSTPNHDHCVYPYLLRGVIVERCNQVWSTDITYIRMRKGFLYLTAVIDWHSRYALSWRLSNTLEGEFCREAVLEALKMGKPEVFNVDQGAQFTCREFVQLIIGHGIKLSMDGKGRYLDNILIERLWRTVKYEEVYLKDYLDGMEAYFGLVNFFKFYNNERIHQSLGYRPPRKLYFGE
jgi:putative transposase